MKSSVPWKLIRTFACINAKVNVMTEKEKQQQGML